MKEFPLVIGLMSIVLGACGGSPDITATVQAAVESTLVSMPTGTAYPTHTPLPTFTPFPPTPTQTNIPPASLPHTLAVPADVRWQPTNVFLTEGQEIRISAIGSVNLGGGVAEATFGPDGGFGPCRAEDEEEYPCNMIGARYGALVGNIDSGEAFLVGSRAVIVASQSGQLYLASNSVSLGDNIGHFTVRIEEP